MQFGPGPEGRGFWGAPAEAALELDVDEVEAVVGAAGVDPGRMGLVEAERGPQLGRPVRPHGGHRRRRPSRLGFTAGNRFGNPVSAEPRTTALFVTCLVDQLFPEVGEAAVRLLEGCGRRVAFPAAQTCCGQPAFNMGYAGEARRLARRMIEIFEPFGEVVTPSGSCASMVRVQFPELFEADPAWRARAQGLAAKTFELTELLAREGFDPLNSRFEGRVTYHPSCHLLRELKVRDAPRTLLEKVPGLELVELPDAEVCCGFGGAFSAKMPELSLAMLDDKLAAAASTGARVLTATDCGCLMHLGGALRRRRSALEVRHVATLLADRGD